MSDIDKLTKKGIQNIPAYIPGRTSESVKEKYGLDKVLKLASNENQYGVSPKAVEAMVQAATEANIYPDPFCLQLRKKLGKKFGFDESGDNVIISQGGCGIIALLGEVFITEGDEMICCDPTFDAYAGACRRNGGIVVKVPVTKEQLYDLDGIFAAITEKTKMIFICNPNNPTGTAVDSSALMALIKKIPKHIITVVDEAYIELATDPAVRSMVPLITEDLNLIVIRTFSKLYGMAGVRVGYSFMNKELHATLQKATTVFVAGRIALAGVMAAMDDEEFVLQTRKGISQGRNYLTKELTAMGWKVFESHTNFIYTDSGLQTAALANELEKYGLIIRGNFKYSRITIGTMEQNKEVIEIIKKVISKGNVPKSEQ